MGAFRKQGYMRYSDFFVQLTKIQEAKEWHETGCICKNVLVYPHKKREEGENMCVHIYAYIFCYKIL